MIKPRWPLFLGAFSAALAVIMNALGAHALLGILVSNGQSNIFNTALHMHEMHALGLLIVSLTLLLQSSNQLWRIAAGLMFFGQIFFCGNLYFASLYGASPFHWLTPIGGFCLISSWVLFGLGVFFQPKNES